MSNRSKSLKNNCLEIQGHKCYWCGREIFIYEGWDRSMPLPKDYSTVDHIFTMKDPRRAWYKKNKTPSPFVLSCRECNEARGSMLVESMEDRHHKQHRNWRKHFTAGAIH